MTSTRLQPTAPHSTHAPTACQPTAQRATSRNTRSKSSWLQNVRPNDASAADGRSVGRRCASYGRHCVHINNRAHHHWLPQPTLDAVTAGFNRQKSGGGALLFKSKRRCWRKLATEIGRRADFSMTPIQRSDNCINTCLHSLRLVFWQAVFVAVCNSRRHRLAAIPNYCRGPGPGASRPSILIDTPPVSPPSS